MHGSLRRLVSGVLIGALVGGGSLPLALAQAPTGTASLKGRLFWEDSGEPISGATVHCIHLDTKAVLTAEPSAADGRYVLQNLPFGYYDCAVSTPQGLCLANRVINVPAGETVEISMVIGAPNPEDTEWWSADSARKLPGLNEVPDSVCRIYEGVPKTAPRSEPKEAARGTARHRAATQGRWVDAAGHAWLVPALVGGGLAALLVIVNSDNDKDENGTPF